MFVKNKNVVMFLKTGVFHLSFLVIVSATMLMGTLIKISPEVSKRLPDPINNEDYYEAGEASQAEIELGEMLFFDKILSGNKNISCATCHHPSLASGDGVALPLGEGADGLGPDRLIENDKEKLIHERVPRNSPGLFNLGAKEFVRLFHDGRVEVDSFGYYDGGFITPAKWKLPLGLDNVLAAQALFPVTSPAEMAGQRGENSLAEAKALNNLSGENGLWEQLAVRLQEIPEYVDLFQRAYPDEVSVAEDISMVMAANAIATFEANQFRADQSPFDVFLSTGEGLAENELRGLELFYGKANCDNCHSGKFQTDHDFHAIAMPQIGPGKSDGYDGSYWRETGIKAFVEDFGRGSVTFEAEDSYKFRTPSLRNVALTAPYGHSGAFQSLEEVVRHHLNPIHSLDNYIPDEHLLPPLDRVAELTADGPKIIHHEMSESRKRQFDKRDLWVQKNEHLRNKIAEANELVPLNLNDAEIQDLVAFLEALTDPRFTEPHKMVPARVPSGLAIDR